jgi:hypothetical protein
MRRIVPPLLLLASASLASCAHAPRTGTAPDPASAMLTVQQALDNAHAQDAHAFYRMSIDEVMALRTDDFQWIAGSSGTRTELETEAWLARLFTRVQEINDMASDIEGLALDGDEARAVVRQRMSRLQRLPDGDLHRVEIWTTQRETWVHTDKGWKLRRVEVTETPTVTVDGKPGTLAAVEP